MVRSRESEDEKMTRVGVIGCGFVGGSLAQVLVERGVSVYAYDKLGKLPTGAYFGTVPSLGGARPESITTFVEACEKSTNFSGVFFVCLPTPMVLETGKCDTSIVEGALDELAAVGGERIAVVKSTVPPGSTERWNKKYEGTGLRVVFSPEFLTEKNALEDTRNQSRIILGGPRPHINRVKQIFQTAFPKVPIVKTNSTTAEFVKYFTNVHLAARVVLSCELYQVCNELDKRGLNIDYDKVVEYAKLDPRLGNSHMSVPGNDGIAGSRGHCFPKDIGALRYIANGLGVKSTVMSAIIEKNLEIVPPEHRDWEKMLGRAIVKKGSE